MTEQRNSTRTRLVKAAMELFVSKGITETTTREIAELAQVNEVTIFRNFKSKYGLLLAVIEDSDVFTHVVESLIKSPEQANSFEEAIQDYANACLEHLERFPELVCSVLGEARQYPTENREALGSGFTQANIYLARYLEAILERSQLELQISPEKLAGLLNSILLGYSVIEFTCLDHQLWEDRADFLASLVTLWMQGAIANLSIKKTQSQKVADLPAHLVHLLLQKAKRLGKQEYALVYVLFGAGLSPPEIVNLQQAHHICYAQGQLLQVTQGSVRQVPVNQSILGKRYGSYTRNPLTQWLKSRRDNNPALFVNQSGNSLSETEIYRQWQELATGLLTPEGYLPRIEQAQQTWCVEMLMRGISLENLQLLIGWDLVQLQPYAHRAKEKEALEQAFLLDQQQ